MAGFIPSEDAKFSKWSEIFRAKLLEILEAFGLIRHVGGTIAGGGTTINLAQGPFTPDIRIRAKNDSAAMVGISIGLAATATTFIEPAITGGKVVGFGEEKTFLLSELGTGNFLNMTNPYLDAGSLQVSIGDIKTLEINSKIIEVQQHIVSAEATRNDWKQEASEKNIAKKNLVRNLLRPFIQHKIKANDAYTEAIGKDLGITEEHIYVDPSTLKPHLIALLAAGEVEIRWIKGVADGIYIEKDKGDGKGFVFLDKDNEPDYQDKTPMPATAQVWKYRAMYLIKDNKVGAWSDVVSITVIN